MRAVEQAVDVGLTSNLCLISLKGFHGLGQAT